MARGNGPPWAAAPTRWSTGRRALSSRKTYDVYGVFYEAEYPYGPEYWREGPALPEADGLDAEGIGGPATGERL